MSFSPVFINTVNDLSAVNTSPAPRVYPEQQQQGKPLTSLSWIPTTNRKGLKQKWSFTFQQGFQSSLQEMRLGLRVLHLKYRELEDQPLTHTPSQTSDLTVNRRGYVTHHDIESWAFKHSWAQEAITVRLEQEPTVQEATERRVQAFFK